ADSRSDHPEPAQGVPPTGRGPSPRGGGACRRARPRGSDPGDVLAGLRRGGRGAGRHPRSRPGGVGGVGRAQLRHGPRPRDQAPPRRQGRQLPRAGRPADPGQGDAGADQGAGDSARLDRRLDLRRPERAHPGHRAGRQGSQAVPLPSPLAGGARREQVRTDAGVRGSATQDPAARHRGHGAPRHVPREGAGHGRPPAGDDPDPRRQRGVRAHQRVVRAHDDARRARRGRRQPDPLPLPGQERRRARDRRPRPAPRGDGQALPGPARTGAVPVHRRQRRAPHCDVRRRQRLPARGGRRGVHGEGLPNLGGDGAGGTSPPGVRRVRQRGRGEAEHPAGGRGGRPAARQHAHHLPQVLRPPRRARVLCRRDDAADAPGSGGARAGRDPPRPATGGGRGAGTPAIPPGPRRRPGRSGV
ncbi:MAG: DNA topoisomerase IB (poxvirus type), partial [uncultured Thermomicrobiales bacterium]